MDQSTLKTYLSYDKDTGFFTWVNCNAKWKNGRQAGTDKGNGYILIKLMQKQYYAHRLAFLYELGFIPDEIDHVDGNKSNNSIKNLRPANRSQNNQNQRKAPVSNKSSGLLGVSWDNKSSLWRARIKINKKEIMLGRFSDKNEAHLSYIKAKRTIHEYCTI